jgi:hypothetical protein
MLTALEMPLNVIERADCPYVNKAEGIGGVPKSTYIELRVVFPKLILAHEEELSDDELLRAAEQAGSFAFLDSPEEDIYSSSGRPGIPPK